MSVKRVDQAYIDVSNVDTPLIREYQGLTTDTKPTDLTDKNNGSTFLAINETTSEVETLYVYNHPTWNEV